MTTEERIINYINQLRNDGFEAVCFLLPAYNTGGGTYYLCELAKKLAGYHFLKVYYVDYKDGYPTRLLGDNSNVTIIEQVDDELEYPIYERTVFITNSTRVTMIKQMRDDNKFLFWHYETVPCAWDRVLINGEAPRFIQLCYEKKAMVFHDWSSKNIINQQFGVNFIGERYLYMCLKDKAIYSGTRNKRRDDEINVCWIGRISPEKFYSLINLIVNFANYSTQKKKKMFIVGDGPKLEEVIEFSNKYLKNIEFFFCGTISKSELDEFLLRRIDIIFAMGLSAIEGAALKIPSVIVRLDNKVILGDKFIWLYDTYEKCMGILTWQAADFRGKLSSFREIMSCFDDESIYEEVADKCYSFFKTQMSDFDSLFCDFLQYVSESELSFEDLKTVIPFFPYTCCYKCRKKILFRCHEKMIMRKKHEK